MKLARVARFPFHPDARRREGTRARGPVRRGTRGASLFEACVVLALIALVVAVAAPATHETMAQLDLRTAGQDVASLLNAARARAATVRADVGIRFLVSGGDLTCSMYEDGDGDGIRTDDIRSGVDRLIGEPMSMKSRHPGVTFSFAPGYAGKDPSGAALGDRSDPIRFGRSGICTFTPLGDASPGSIYLSDGRRRQAVVRVTPTTAKISILDVVPGGKGWIKRW